MTGPAPAVAATRVAVRPCLRALDARVALVAVSGGADSLALLAAVAFEAPRAGVAVRAVTVDHGLQAGSAARAAAVVQVAERLGVAAEAVRVEVGGAGGPEAAARDARYAALHECARAHGAAAILLAHTLDDQAETVLLGLARGSGARSLAGMAAESGPLRRPFLGLRRALTREACLAQDLAPWDDPMNDDPAFARVRVRTEALPALEAAIGPGVAEALARTATLLARDADALDAWAAQALAGCRDEVGGLSVEALAGLPDAVRTRVVKAAATAAGVPALTAAHLRALDRLVTDWRGQGAVGLPGAWVGERACGRLVLRPPALPPPGPPPHG